MSSAQCPASNTEPTAPKRRCPATSNNSKVRQPRWRLELLCNEVHACIEEGIATSSALTEGEAGQPPTSNGRFARSVRAEQVWTEVIRIHNHCTTDPGLKDSRS